MKCGLLGRKLGHSYSPEIHSMLCDYSYVLFEREPEELEDFLKNGDFDGINVTIPYKKAVVPYCSELSESAKILGSVNTIVRRSDGSLYGANTDYNGFSALIKKSGIDIKGKKAIVLGNGGASVTICGVLRNEGAGSVTVISRSGEDNYENISKHADAEIIVNTTPLGMYPNTGVAAVDLTMFPKCCGVLDVVYNPARTALILQAEKLGIPCAGGLYMLVAQAKRAAEIFTGTEIDDAKTDSIMNVLSSKMQNIVLIGMPGSGKTSVSKKLAELTGRAVYDSDEYIVNMTGRNIPDIINNDGEKAFRDIECKAIAEVGKLSGNIISTGGGAVLREENYDSLHQNGVIILLSRNIDVLPKDGRPISQKSNLAELYAYRKPFYERFADYIVDNNGSIDDTVSAILEVLK